MKIIFLLPVLLIFQNFYAQENYKDKKPADSLRVFYNNDFHEVKEYQQGDFGTGDLAKNIILFIGDGMGTTQLFSGLTANKGQLFMKNFKYIGFSKTSSASDIITDSGAGGTAIATGKKTYNGAISVDTNKNVIPTILELAEKKGKATGLVSTSSITHATPASFIAHEESRSHYEAIAKDFLDVDIDVFMGGGKKHFKDRKDGLDLTKTLEE
ncbi:MAG: alkaline phosphatase, partial [Bacteroidota bacterium]